jgi:hypothetical protein
MALPSDAIDWSKLMGQTWTHRADNWISEFSRDMNEPSVIRKILSGPTPRWMIFDEAGEFAQEMPEGATTLHKASGGSTTRAANPARRRAAAAKAPDPAVAEDKAKRVAAAEIVVREITMAYQEDEDGEEFAGSHQMAVVDAEYSFKAMTGDGFRTIKLPLGHNCKWRGKARASASGKVLFILEPDSNAWLRARRVSIVEVPHDELERAFGRAPVDWLVNAMGVEIDDMIRDAMNGVTPSERQDALGLSEQMEEEVMAEESTTMEDWGAWA